LRNSHSRARTVRRVLLSLLAGTCVFGTAYVAAWRNVRDVTALTWRRSQTRAIFKELQDAVEQQRSATGVLPAALDNLAEVKERRFDTDNNGRVVDAWGHAFVYSQTDDGYEIWSYGRDGRAGGVGLDADVCADGRGYDNSLPTLRQFALERNTRGILGACLASGLLAAVTYLLLSRKQRDEQGAVGNVLANMLGTLLFSVLVAAVLVVLHIPSGH